LPYQQQPYTRTFRKTKGTPGIMRSLEELKSEVDHLNLEIRRLLLGKNPFKESLSEKIAVATTITTLRERIVKLQREIRTREDEQEIPTRQ
jgi:hypothetical protein